MRLIARAAVPAPTTCVKPPVGGVRLTHQRIFCSEDCVTTWLDRSGRLRGYVMDVPTLWRLASGWYAGRLERGYVRREPSAAADYLRSVGLSGTFWGFPD